MIFWSLRNKNFGVLGLVVAAILISAVARISYAAGPDQSLSDVIVISDIDDTIRHSNILNQAETVLNYASSTRAFDGMPELYRHLSERGARIDYVSSIREIIRANPGSKIILVGDDGQDDPKIFAQIQADPKLGPHLKGMDVHELFNNSLPDGETPFFTTGDLAVQIHKDGFVSKDDALKAVRTSEHGLNDVPKRQRLTFPDFATVSLETVQSQLDALIGTETDPRLQLELRGLKSDLAVRLRSNPRAVAECIKDAIGKKEAP